MMREDFARLDSQEHFFEGSSVVTPNRVLKEARIKRQLSQEEVANAVATTSPNVSRWERGVTIPTPYFRRKLCEYFNIAPEQLFPEQVKLNPPSETGTQENTSTEPLIHNYTSIEKPSPLSVNHLFAEDIFFCNLRIPSPTEFFGCARAKSVLRRIKAGQSVSLVGPHKSGKTWLLDYLKMAAGTELGQPVIIGYLDAGWSGCETLLQFLVLILRELEIPEPVDQQESIYLQALKLGIREMQSRQVIPVLCLDRIERLCKIPGLSLDTLDQLRTMTQYGLRLVTASRQPLKKVIEDAFTGTSTSPFYNVFMQFKLGPFMRSEAEEFVRMKGTQAGFTAEERDKLLQYAQQKGTEQWYPQKLQLVGTLLYEDIVLARAGYLHRYRPQDPTYWQEFEQRMNEDFQE